MDAEASTSSVGKDDADAGPTTAGVVVGLCLLAAATLALEVALTRVFALAQGYHFAFVAVGIALLGLGASGSLLAVLGPGLARAAALRWASALGFGASAAAAYGLAGGLPFDSYRLAAEPGQVALAALTYLALALPFFWSGLAVASTLEAQPARAGLLYSANLVGSAGGCLLALVLLPLAGAGGAILLAAALGAAAAVGFAGTARQRTLAGLAVLALALPAILARPGTLEPRLSPYRGLSQALRLPGAEVVWSRWNSFSRVDLVQARALRSAPGLSLSYTGTLPAQMAVAVDGDNLQPVSLVPPEGAEFLDYTPAAAAYLLRPAPAVLLLEGGNSDLLLALRSGARVVVDVRANPLAREAAEAAYALAGVGWSPGRDARIEPVESAPRGYLRRTRRQFDVIQLGLAEGFRPVTAGAFSLAEDYSHTVEAFEECYRHLAPGGVLVATRWLQVPPSEDLRLFALAIQALRQLGVQHPEAEVAVLRDYQTLTLFVRAGGLGADDVARLLAFADARSYDVVYAPGAPESAANRYHVLPHAEHRRTFLAVLSPYDGRQLEESYPYDVRPPTDDRPFFGSLFRWRQAPEVLRLMGKTWQPFGGAGYLVIVGLLVLTVVTGSSLLTMPLLLRRPAPPSTAARGPSLARTTICFGALGVGYLGVEIPSMQKLILVLDQPTYAVAVVLASLLLWSGIGSLASEALVRRLGGRVALAALVACLLAYQLGLSQVVGAILGLDLAPRLVAVALLLAPAGFLMGVPFAAGVRALGRRRPDLVPWAWAANGFASVTCSVLAAMLALAAGFSAVLAAATVAYAVAAAAWPGDSHDEQDTRDEQGGRRK